MEAGVLEVEAGQVLEVSISGVVLRRGAYSCCTRTTRDVVAVGKEDDVGSVEGGWGVVEGHGILVIEDIPNCGEVGSARFHDRLSHNFHGVSDGEKVGQEWGGRFVGWCEVASVVCLDRVGEEVLVAGMVEEGDKVVGPGGPVCGGICLSGPFGEDVNQDWVSAIPALIGCHGPILIGMFGIDALVNLVNVKIVPAEISVGVQVLDGRMPKRWRPVVLLQEQDQVVASCRANVDVHGTRRGRGIAVFGR